jgi:beta-glucosidase/6-phospho-beta-glucosidase/beta-galactosidase
MFLHSDVFNSMSGAGDTGTEPYLCAHNVLLSHAAAASVYRNEFAPSQGGEIGMTLNTDWSQPLTDSQADKVCIFLDVHCNSFEFPKANVWKVDFKQS